MPPKTGVPTSRLASWEAPVAITKGSRPSMNANEVIMTGRNRRRAPSVAASSKGTPLSLCSFANSTMRMPFFAANAGLAVCNHRNSRIFHDNCSGGFDT